MIIVENIQIIKTETCGDIMLGTCELCGKTDVVLSKTYFKYSNIKCGCHAPQHFEVIYHCKDCKPVEPMTTVVYSPINNNKYLIETSKLKSLDHILEGYELVHYLREHGTLVHQVGKEERR